MQQSELLPWMKSHEGEKFTVLKGKLMDFLDKSVNAFFAVENMKNTLEEEGFQPLYEGEDWNLKKGGKYFVTRNGSALIAFVLRKSLLKDSR